MLIQQQQEIAKLPKNEMTVMYIDAINQLLQNFDIPYLQDQPKSRQQ